MDIPREQVEAEPWHAVWSPDGTWPGQAERQAEVVARCGAELGDRVYLAEDAAIACESLRIGDRSYVARGCVLRDRVEIGDDCSLNPYVVVAGRVRLGDGVRIASFAALYGFNHRFDDLHTPIWVQDLDEEGIVVEDDVWIGTHVVICDGVTVGAHSVLAAGTVVTRDVPPWSVVAGVPGRVQRDRRDGSTRDDHGEGSAAGPATSTRPRDQLARFDDRVREQWPEVLARCATDTDHGPARYVDAPGEPWRIRPTCDAIEIAGAFGDPAQAGPPDELARWLADLQDPATGLFPEPSEPPPGDDPLELRLDAEFQQYGVLSVGYALEVLGSGPRHPVRALADITADELVARLDALPWAELAWPAGSWVDFCGTAIHMDRTHHGTSRHAETLLGWLATRVDPDSGMWGAPHPEWGWLMPVNGFYRLTRGTYAQMGLDLPHPEAAIDTVAKHARQYGWFAERDRSACNVLDVVHPLWLAARQVDHRRSELRDAVAAALDETLGQWVDGEGFAFAPGQAPGLQGTEMWLSIVHLMAAYLDEVGGLSWQPRGVHRLEPTDPRPSLR